MSMTGGYIFFTGVPGSKWSGVSQAFRHSWPWIDNSDITDEKTYKHHAYGGHQGNYFGPGLTFGNWLDQRCGTGDDWRHEIDLAFGGPSPQPRLILAHHFAYWLDDLVSEFPDSPIVICYRPNEASFRWWKEAGGFDISYPSYSWYENDEKMWDEIVKQNNHIRNFTTKHGLHFNEPYVDFFRHNFGVDRDFVLEGKDVRITVKK